jgi:alkylhydroperoxidase family enzyme
MPWIEVIPPQNARGALRRAYDDAEARAGKVFHIVRAMSQAPRVLEAAFELYKHVMFAPRGLSRRRREMLAVVVSATNHCHY